MASNNSVPRPGRSYVLDIDDPDSDASESPIELPDGTYGCRPHGLSTCPHCGVSLTSLRSMLGIPEDSDDDDDSDGPIQLPNGSLVCRPHRLKVCGYCCVDFSFMDELQEDSEDQLERETDELYQQLSDESRADIDARWGPPRRATAQANSSPSAGMNANPIVLGPVLAAGAFDHALDDASDDAFDNTFGDAIKRGTGQVFPTKFALPSAASTPGELFPAGIGRQAIPNVVRFIRRNDAKQVLIYADGACLNNGQANPKAGWAFYFKPETDRPAGIVSARLEKRGPFGEVSTQTSNRAELRAIIGALRFRHWKGEGFATVVFATDSEYVAEGATAWTRGWVRNGWKTRTGADVKNKDLWEALLGEVERWDSHGVKVQFWRIPRTLNTAADRAAKQAAENQEDVDRFCDIKGILS